MIGRNASDARGVHRFGRCDISISGKSDRLGEAVAFLHNIDNGFVSGQGVAVNFHPPVDHDKKCGRRIVLPHDQFVRPQHDGRRRLNNVLNGLRLKPSEYRNAGDDLQIAGRQL